MSTFVIDTEKMERDLDFNALGAKVLEEIKKGQPMFGKDGAFAPMLEKILNAALEGEMDAHLTEESRYRKRVPRDLRTVMHSPSDKELHQVCGQQASEGVHG